MFQVGEMQRLFFKWGGYLFILSYVYEFHSVGPLPVAADADQSLGDEGGWHSAEHI